MNSAPFLAIVIPAYNEEKRIGSTLKLIAEYLSSKSLSHEYVISDDGCRDNTEGVVREALGGRAPLRYIKAEKNMGKGHAVKTGMLSSTAQFSLLTDADLSTPISELDKFLPLMDSDRAVVVGTRKTTGASVTKHQHFIRENMGKCFTLLTNAVLNMRQSDFTCGFKVFGSLARWQIFNRMRINRWGYDAELLFLAKCYGFAIREVPVVWANSEATRVNLALDTMRTFKELFEIRLNQCAGRY